MKAYQCPLSSAIPNIPVITNDGYTYDFVFIARRLLQENNLIDPINGLKINKLIYNKAIKSINDEVLLQKGQASLPSSKKEKISVVCLMILLRYRYPTLKIEGFYFVFAHETITALLSHSHAVGLILTFLSNDLGRLDSMMYVVHRALLASENPNLVVSRFLGINLLYYAAMCGRLDIVLILLREADAYLNTKDADGVTPLFIAAQNGHAYVVEVLLMAGVSPHQTRSDGVTAFSIAAQNGHADVIEVLLMAGVSPHQTRSDGVTVLSIAVQNGHADAVKVLLKAGVSPYQTGIDVIPLLFIAVQNRHANVVEVLLRADVPLNQTRSDGVSALFIATQKGYSDIVNALLAAGADPRQAAICGAIPLYTAIFYGHFEIALRLLPFYQPGITYSSYAILVESMLSDEAVRDYYLKQFILKPDIARDVFKNNPVFFQELVKHGPAIWQRLQMYLHFNLSFEEYVVLLTTILNSRSETDESLRHPLYTLFNAPQLQQKVQQKDCLYRRWLNGVFSRDNPVIILDHIQQFISYIKKSPHYS